MQPFALGDRVVYRDPEQPRDPMPGVVVKVTEHAVHVHYDRHSLTVRPARIAAELAADLLRFEEHDGLTPPLARPSYWRGVEQ
jgi:hypothetical protein